MLDSITLKFTENPDLTIPLDGITIFVGANNSGKSLVLKEVESAMAVHPFPGDLKILREYEIKWPSVDQIKVTLQNFERFREIGLPEGQVRVGRINPNSASKVHR